MYIKQRLNSKVPRSWSSEHFLNLSSLAKFPRKLIPEPGDLGIRLLIFRGVEFMIRLQFWVEYWAEVRRNTGGYKKEHVYICWTIQLPDGDDRDTTAFSRTIPLSTLMKAIGDGPYPVLSPAQAMLKTAKILAASGLSEDDPNLETEDLMKKVRCKDPKIPKQSDPHCAYLVTIFENIALARLNGWGWQGAHRKEAGPRNGLMGGALSAQDGPSYVTTADTHDPGMLATNKKRKSARGE